MKKFSSVIINLHLLRKEWYGIIVKKARSHISHSSPSLLPPISDLIPLRGLFLLVARHNQSKLCFCSRFLRRFRFPFPPLPPSQVGPGWVPPI